MKNTNLKILDFLKSERNFDYSGYHFAMLERRIQNRIIHLGSASTEAYFEYLQNNPGEPTLLIENFMINVSHFFRDPLSFELLARVIIPTIVASKLRLNEHSIRIWSAGCAHGEEAYSVAMLFNEYFNQEFQKLILNKLLKSLAPKGVLMLGESEVLGDPFREELRQISKYAKIFEKK